MRRELSIYRYQSGNPKTGHGRLYELRVPITVAAVKLAEFRGFETAQEVFDFCAEIYPGEPVTVDIRP